MKKPFITLPAHFDGNSIILDAAYELQPQDKLLVTILKSESESDERNEWLTLSSFQLIKAYSEEEAQYSLSLIKEPNPEFHK